MNLEELRRLAKEPAEPCPCCGRPSKVYKRKFIGNMAAALCLLVRHGDWIHVRKMPRFVADDRVISFLAYWNLAVPKSSDNPDKKPASGIWKATPRGKAFVERLIKIPAYLYIRNGHILGKEPTYIDIEEALSKTFNYRELMSGERYES